MKKTIVKLVAATLSLIIMISAFSACGSNSEEEITRSSEVIAKPEITTQDIFSQEETTTQEESTTEEETTTAAGLLDDFDLPTTTRVPSTTASSGTGTMGALQSLDPNAIAQFVTDMGFQYDTEQGIFYSKMDSWQRSANYFSHYDSFAKFGNMRYLTAKVDFTYDGLDYRLQLWKGQYGIFGGAEMGIYTKQPGTNEKVYKCADDDHLLNMYFDLYQNENDYTAGNRYFYRDAWTGVGHWWLTGFKFGTVVPPDMVLYGKIHMKTNGMAAAFEQGLKRARFGEGDALSSFDTYRRDGKDFYFLWKGIGSLNY